jgi:hypothetical protein
MVFSFVDESSEKEDRIGSFSPRSALSCGSIFRRFRVAEIIVGTETPVCAALIRVACVRISATDDSTQRKL